MADRVKVRGCCCGIPFGCGVFVVLGGALALWQAAAPALSSLVALFAR